MVGVLCQPVRHNYCLVVMGNELAAFPIGNVLVYKYQKRFYKVEAPGGQRAR